MSGQAKQQKILTPTFNPGKQPGAASRFSNSPFQKFFGSWQVPLIPAPSAVTGPWTTVANPSPESVFKSQQDPRTIPSRLKR